MKSNHAKASFRDSTTVFLKHPIHVFVVTPRHGQVGYTASLLVHTIRGAINWIFQIGILLEGFQAEHAFISWRTPYWKGITNNCPLLQRTLASDFWKSQHFPDVM